jgi:hypothetical protein
VRPLGLADSAIQARASVPGTSPFSRFFGEWKRCEGPHVHFVAVARQGGVNAAARETGIPKATLSLLAAGVPSFLIE